MRILVALTVAAALLAPLQSQAQRPPKTYVIVHGAWGGAWDWKAVDSLLTSRGQRVHRVTLTGLGERYHLASPLIGLETHITDVVNALVWEDLRDVVLVGHSYGGMVITGVADRIPERLRRLVYVDAFVPDSGESVHSLFGGRATWVDSTVSNGMSAPFWVKDSSAIPRDVPQSYRTFTDQIRLVNPLRSRVPGTYILTYEPDALPDPFQPFADRATARGWVVRRLQTTHVPERDARGPLVDLLVAVP